MHKLAGLLALIFVLLQSGGTALTQTCEYAGQDSRMSASAGASA